MKAIFESDILTSRSKPVFKVYQKTFTKFVSSLKTAALTVTTYGTIDVDLAMPSVTHLWSKVKIIIINANYFMKPFLKLFGVEYGNGLSPIDVDMDISGDLIKLIKYL